MADEAFIRVIVEGTPDAETQPPAEVLPPGGGAPPGNPSAAIEATIARLLGAAGGMAQIEKVAKQVGGFFDSLRDAVKKSAGSISKPPTPPAGETVQRRPNSPVGYDSEAVREAAANLTRKRDFQRKVREEVERQSPDPQKRERQEDRTAREQARQRDKDQDRERRDRDQDRREEAQQRRREERERLADEREWRRQEDRRRQRAEKVLEQDRKEQQRQQESDRKKKEREDAASQREMASMQRRMERQSAALEKAQARREAREADQQARQQDRRERDEQRQKEAQQKQHQREMASLAELAGKEHREAGPLEAATGQLSRMGGIFGSLMNLFHQVARASRALTTPARAPEEETVPGPAATIAARFGATVPRKPGMGQGRPLVPARPIALPQGEEAEAEAVPPAAIPLPQPPIAQFPPPKAVPTDEPPAAVPIPQAKRLHEGGEVGSFQKGGWIGSLLGRLTGKKPVLPSSVLKPLLHSSVLTPVARPSILKPITPPGGPPTPDSPRRQTLLKEDAQKVLQARTVLNLVPPSEERPPFDRQEYERRQQLLDRRMARRPPPLPRGAGTSSGRPDDVPIMAQEGEFVVRREAAQKNLPLLEKINQAPDAPSAPGHFQKGGAVGAAAGLIGGGAGGALAAAAGPIGSIVEAAVTLMSKVKESVTGAVRAVGDFTVAMASPDADPSRMVAHMGEGLDGLGDKLFYVNPALGIMASATGEATKGLSRFMQALDGMVQRYGKLSPQIATAEAIGQVVHTLGDLKRANQVAPALTQYIAARTQMQQKIEDAKARFIVRITPLAIQAMQILEKILPVIERGGGVLVEMIRPLAAIIEILTAWFDWFKDKDGLSDFDTLEPFKDIMGSLKRADVERRRAFYEATGRRPPTAGPLIPDL